MALVGNKSDLFENQQIPDEEIKKKGEELKVKVKITSAAENGAIFKLFLEELLKDYVQEIGELKKEANTFTLKEEKLDEDEKENNKKNNVSNNKTKKKKRFC